MNAAAQDATAQPTAPARRRKASTEKRRNPEQRVLFTILPDGSFRAADSSSRKILKGRDFHRGQEVIAYLYRVRDSGQWRRAHVLGTLLAEHVEEFHGLDAHQALKKIQELGEIACEPRRFPLPKALQDLLGGVTHINLPVPRSLAFGEMDDGEFSAVYKQMADYVTRTYFADMDASAVEAMLDVMPEAP